MISAILFVVRRAFLQLIQYSPQAYTVIVRFRNKVMAELVDVGVDATVGQMPRRLPPSLRGVSGGFRHGYRHVTAWFLGPDRTFMASSNFG